MIAPAELRVRREERRGEREREPEYPPPLRCRFEGEIVWDTSKPNGQPRRMLDTSRALREFGWKARISFEDGLRETIEWFERNR